MTRESMSAAQWRNCIEYAAAAVSMYSREYIKWNANESDAPKEVSVPALRGPLIAYRCPSCRCIAMSLVTANGINEVSALYFMRYIGIGMP
jgi:hypothetical protein